MTFAMREWATLLVLLAPAASDHTQTLLEVHRMATGNPIILPRVCKQCGTEFEYERKPSQRGANQKFCTDECKNRHRLDRAIQKRADKLAACRRHCAGCGAEFAPEHWDQYYCRKDCGKAICLGCGKRFRPQKVRREQFHSKRCWLDWRTRQSPLNKDENRLRQQAIRLRELAETIWAACEHKIPCEECGRLFVPWPANKVTCGKQCLSDRCSRLAAKKTDDQRGQRKQCVICHCPLPYGERAKQCCPGVCRKILKRQTRQRAVDKRRARLAGVVSGYYTVQQILERDHWVCQICGAPIPQGLLAPHPLSATIDHRIAIVNGGADDESNVQAAHFLCNSRKGDRSPEQALL